MDKTDPQSAIGVNAASNSFSFNQPGTVIFSYHQDVLHTCNYFWGDATLHYAAGGTRIVSRELNSHTRQMVRRRARDARLAPSRRGPRVALGTVLSLAPHRPGLRVAPGPVSPSAPASDSCLALDFLTPHGPLHHRPTVANSMTAGRWAAWLP